MYIPGSEQEGALFKGANLLLPFEKDSILSRNCDSLSLAHDEEKVSSNDTNCCSGSQKECEMLNVKDEKDTPIIK